MLSLILLQTFATPQTQTNSLKTLETPQILCPTAPLETFFSRRQSFVKPSTGQRSLQFQVKKDSCGLIENTIEPAHEGKREYRNTIIIQKHADYQDRYDSAKSIICTWFNLLRTSITQKPIIVGSLNEEDHIQTDNSVEVFIDVRRGKLRWTFFRTQAASLSARSAT